MRAPAHVTDIAPTILALAQIEELRGHLAQESHPLGNAELVGEPA